MHIEWETSLKINLQRATVITTKCDFVNYSYAFGRSALHCNHFYPVIIFGWPSQHWSERWYRGFCCCCCFQMWIYEEISTHWILIYTRFYSILLNDEQQQQQKCIWLIDSLYISACRNIIDLFLYTFFFSLILCLVLVFLYELALITRQLFFFCSPNELMK